MNPRYVLLLLVWATLLAGCSSSHKATVTESVQPEETAPDSSAFPATPIGKTSPATADNARDWTPRFIPTGSASGIMLEFTGMKKNATLHARFAAIQLTRDTTGREQLPPSFSLSTTINDLRQAFFKVPPGKYLLHQTKDWAEQFYIRDVEVREGNYSVVTIEVLNPRVPRNKEISDSTTKK